MPGTLEVIEPGQQATEYHLGHQRRRSTAAPCCLSSHLPTWQLLAEQTLLQRRRRIEGRHPAGRTGSKRVFADIGGGDYRRLGGRYLADDKKVIERQIEPWQELAEIVFQAGDPVQRPVMVIAEGFAQGHQTHRDRLGADRIVARREIRAPKQCHEAKIDTP